MKNTINYLYKRKEKLEKIIKEAENTLEELNCCFLELEDLK